MNTTSHNAANAPNNAAAKSAPPHLAGVDHIHIYVGDRAAAEQWYGNVLGFKRVEELMLWADEHGPLTVEDAAATIHLALFERPDHPPTSAIAFRASGAGFLEWKAHLEAQGFKLRVADHTVAWSLYFCDPWENMHEITTMEYDYVAQQLKQA